MCKGLGLDLCEVARMEKMLADSRFLSRYFTPGEIDYIHSRGKSRKYGPVFPAAFSQGSYLQFIAKNGA